MDHTTQIEKLLRCRKCFRTGAATWEVSSRGTPKSMKVLLALSDGKLAKRLDAWRKRQTGAVGKRPKD